MATSSITANFSIRDPKEARRFLSRLLSTQNPMPFPEAPDFKFVTSVKNLRKQIAKSN